MRSKVLGLATAAVAAGALTLVPATPVHAAGGMDGGNISNSGDVPNSVDVAAFGSGDAVAAWARPVPGGTKVYAAISTNGVWGAPKAVTAAAVTDAHDVQAVANDAGDLAVVWNQTTGGEHKVRGSRYLPNGTWDGSTLLSPAVDIETVTGIDAGIDGAGRVHLAYQAEDGGFDSARATFWKEGSTPTFTDFGAGSQQPAIDVNPAGAALLSFYTPSGGGTIKVTRRNASLGWLGPKTVAWPNSVNKETVTGLADDGRGAVMLGGLDDDAKTRAVVAKVTTSGDLGAANPVSAAGTSAQYRDLSVSPNGTMQASWTAFENGTTYLIRQATALPGAGFGPSGIAEPGTSGNQKHVGLVSDRRTQVVVHGDADALTLRYRTNPILSFSNYAAETADVGPFAADMDDDGNAVIVGVQEQGLSSYVNADWLDVTGPRTTVTAPGPQVVSKSFDVKWSAVDTLAGMKTTDVIASSAAWNSGTFSAPSVVGPNVVANELKVTGGLGRTYCYEVQGEDLLDNIGARSTRKCTSVPLDDTALLGSGWSRADKSGQFNGTWTTTSTKGRTLTRTGIKAKRLALVANRLSNGGLVEVRWNGTVIKKISLKGTTATKKVYPIVTWSGLHTGTLTIKVISATGRPVRLDGLVVAK